MFFWFAGGSVVLVWAVFHSTRLDYRLIIAGAVLPTIENLTGHDLVLHTLAAPVVVLVIVMVATRHARVRRRRWLCLPIGLFSALILDGAWTRNELFWWPVFGTVFPAESSLLAARSTTVNFALEALGLAALIWLFRRFELDNPVNRQRFVKTGTFDPTLARGPEAGM